MSYCLGVDIGTTSVAAAAAQGHRAEMISLGERSLLTGAAVSLGANGTIVTGDLATRDRQHNRVSCEIKRRLGDPTPIILGGSAHSVPVLLAQIVGDVVVRATAARGHRPHVVVLTHPAHWGPYRREMFAEVPRLAGLGTTRMMTEPQAAAVHYDAQRRVGDGEAVAVYHLGGGTCAVAVLRKAADDFVLLGTPEIIEYLGGSDIDEAILGYVTRATGGAFVEPDVADPECAATIAGLCRRCVAAKETLSVESNAVVPVLLADRQAEVPVSRSTLEQLVRPLLDTTIKALLRALKSAQVAPGELSAVLLAGGSTRIPLVGRMLSDVVGCPVLIDPHPEFVVALGAARASAPPLALGVPSSAADAVRAFAGPDRVAPRMAATPVDRADLRPASEQHGDVAEGKRSRPSIAVIVVAALVLVAAMIVALGAFVGLDEFLGGNRTSTFTPTLILTPTPGPGAPAG